VIVQPEVRCVEFVDDLTEWMEGGLTREERAGLEEHLTICPDCTRYLDQMRATITTLRLFEDDGVPPALHAAVLTALRDRGG
jgi:anti-sigma factor RsiW